jgi:heat shock protein HslJ
MRTARILVVLAQLLCCVSLYTTAKSKKVTVTGNLTRVMAVGGESTGWSIELDAEAAIDDKQVHAVEIDYHNAAKLGKLENQRVKAVGEIAHRQGVETGERTVLEISSIKKIAPIPPSMSAVVSFSLPGTEWLLEDLAGGGVIDNVQATLNFPDATKVAGNGSCNRFSGPAVVGGSAIKLGPLASTRMACPEAVMNQETKYLNVLQAAERYEWKDPYLLIYCKDHEKPLRFTRVAKQAPATH